MVLAAPVEVGTIFSDAALPRLLSIPFLCGMSSVSWSFVIACTVDINPDSTQKHLLSRLRTGAKQFVVQDAALNTLSFLSIIFSLTPYTIVLHSSLAGALIKTLFAPASMWLILFSFDVKAPVHSRTKSTFNSFQGNLVGSLSLYTFIFLPSISI